MRFIIQRVIYAKVTVDGKVTGEIQNGFLTLVGAAKGDTEEIADKLISKLMGLRIFSDDNDKTNLSLADIGGELLLVPQFTLYADCKKGYRPSFINAEEPQRASRLFDYIVERCRQNCAAKSVQTGVFGAHMKVELLNDGPFTVILDSAEICR